MQVHIRVMDLPCRFYSINGRPSRIVSRRARAGGRGGPLGSQTYFYMWGYSRVWYEAGVMVFTNHTLHYQRWEVLEEVVLAKTSLSSPSSIPSDIRRLSEETKDHKL